MQLMAAFILMFWFLFWFTLSHESSKTSIKKLSVMLNILLLQYKVNLFTANSYVTHLRLTPVLAHHTLIMPPPGEHMSITKYILFCHNPNLYVM